MLEVLSLLHHSSKKGVGEDTGIEIRASSHTNNEMGEIPSSDLGKEGLAWRDGCFVYFYAPKVDYILGESRREWEESFRLLVRCMLELQSKDFPLINSNCLEKVKSLSVNGTW